MVDNLEKLFEVLRKGDFYSDYDASTELLLKASEEFTALVSEVSTARTNARKAIDAGEVMIGTLRNERDAARSTLALIVYDLRIAPWIREIARSGRAEWAKPRKLSDMGFDPQPEDYKERAQEK